MSKRSPGDDCGREAADGPLAPQLALLVDAVTRTAPVGVALLDEELRFRYVNDKLAAINGLPVEAHLGRTVGEVLPTLADALVPIMRRALEGGEAQVDVEQDGETGAAPGEQRSWLVSYYPVGGATGSEEGRGLGVIVTDVTDRRSLLEAERAAREVAESAMRRLEQVLAISDAALGSLPLDELLGELMARLRSGLDVDTVRILLRTPDGGHLAAGGAIGLQLAAEEDLRIPIGSGISGRIAAQRAPLVLDDVSGIEIVSPALRQSGVTSLAGVPLVLVGQDRVGAGFVAGAAVADDELIGVLHVGSIRPRRFTDEEVDILELAAERIAVAIDRSRVYERERRRRVRAEFVARVNALVTSHLDHRRLMAVVAEAAVPRLADWCSVYVCPVDGEGRPEVAIAHVDPTMRVWARRFSEQFEWDPDAPQGVPAVIRTGRPELYEDIDPALIDALVAADPRLAPLTELRLRSSIVVPLVARGQVTGALQLVRSDGGELYDADDLELATDVAGRVAVALENARLYEASEKVALTLLRSLLPETVPPIPGVEVAVRYRPSAGDVGGDFYDLFPTSGGWGVVVGDVCGKGVVAASMTALVRHTLRAAALSDLTPSDALGLASRALHLGDAGAFCTALYGTLSVGPPAVKLRFAAGGHPLPVVVDPTGVASFVGRHGALLGLGGEPTRHDSVVSLRPGDVLVLYTDGLTDLPPPVGLDDAALLEVVARAAKSGDAEAIADALLADLDGRLEGRAQADDVAVVVLAVRPGGGSSHDHAPAAASTGRGTPRPRP